MCEKILIIYFSTWERRFWIWIRRRLPICSEPCWLSTRLPNSNSPKYRNGKSDEFFCEPKSFSMCWFYTVKSEIASKPDNLNLMIWNDFVSILVTIGQWSPFKAIWAHCGKFWLIGNKLGHEINQISFSLSMIPMLKDLSWLH